MRKLCTSDGEGGAVLDAHLSDSLEWMALARDSDEDLIQQRRVRLANLDHEEISDEYEVKELTTRRTRVHLIKISLITRSIFEYLFEYRSDERIDLQSGELLGEFLADHVHRS